MLIYIIFYLQKCHRQLDCGVVRGKYRYISSTPYLLMRFSGNLYTKLTSQSVAPPHKNVILARAEREGQDLRHKYQIRPSTRTAHAWCHYEWPTLLTVDEDPALHAAREPGCYHANSQVNLLFISCFDLPERISFDHCIEYDNHFSHHGSNSDMRRFSSLF